MVDPFHIELAFGTQKFFSIRSQELGDYFFNALASLAGMSTLRVFFYTTHLHMAGQCIPKLSFPISLLLNFSVKSELLFPQVP